MRERERERERREHKHRQAETAVPVNNIHHRTFRITSGMFV
jgi:hypothetical protein